VRRRRRALGLRQAEVADLAGCSERFVHTVEHGEVSLPLDKVWRCLASTWWLRPGEAGFAWTAAPPTARA